MSNNQMRLDGIAVESHAGRYAGTFDVEEDVGVKLMLGDEVFIVQRAVVQPPGFKTDTNGDLKRIHILAPCDVEFITDPTVWAKILDLVDTTRDQQPLFPRVVDPETGLISYEDEDNWGGWNETRIEPETISATAVTNSEPREEEIALPVGVRVGPPVGAQDPILRRFLNGDGDQ